MIVPTDEMLNRTMAEVLGRDVTILQGHTWRKDEDGEIDDSAWDGDYHNGPRCERCGYIYCVHCHDTCPENECKISHPRYCQDRNTLPQIWSAIESAGKRDEFIHILNDEGWWGSLDDAWFILTATTRQHVIAALKALGKWPSDWSAE